MGVEEDEWLSIKLLVYQNSKNTHHSGAALVKLLVAEFEFLLLTWVSKEANWEGRSREVSREGSLGLLEAIVIKNTNEDDELSKSSTRDLQDSIVTSWDIGERNISKSSWEADARPGGQVSKESELSSTSVLDLTSTPLVELLLVRTL